MESRGIKPIPESQPPGWDGGGHPGAPGGGAVRDLILDKTTVAQ
jgi:hypothetical protein